ncbi:cytochrome c oxidase subunit 2A [Evansella sp. AB-rgal1]|uniref:cytochrome c oxidase subunit 2A n=1 Tax=Evansella sp. AB-rgal1 TaxID=3242696 RepID=UPI00359E0244
MSKSILSKKQSNLSTQEENSSLKGTFIFVMSIGSFILITWFIVFFIFVGRI